MDELDDITLERAIRGNAVAFRCLYAHYSPLVWRMCYRSCNGAAAAAEEIMQNTFVKVYRYIGSFAKGARFSTWLYKIAYNCVNEFFSKQTRHNMRTVDYDDETDYDEENSAEEPLPYETENFVESILSGLTELERFLITAREIDGFGYDELADVTGMKEGAIRQRLMRLKADIRKRVTMDG